MGMFRMFRLGCWQVGDAGEREYTTIYVNPEFVMGIEDKITYRIVFMTYGTYYTESIVSILERGLSDVSKLNKRFVSMN